VYRRIFFIFVLFFPSLLYPWEGARFLSLFPTFPPPRDDIQVSPVFLNPVPLLYLSSQGILVAVSPQGGVRTFLPSGTLLRSLSLGEGTETSGIVSRDSLYLVSEEGRLYRLLLHNFSFSTLREGLPVAVGSGCSSEDVLYWKDAEGGIFATSSTGEILFRFEGLARERTTVRGGGGVFCTSEGEVWILTTAGRVIRVKGGKLLSSTTIPSPVHEGFSERFLVDPLRDEILFCAVRKLCFRFRYSTGELFSKIEDTGSLDGFHLQKERFYLLTSEGTLFVWDRKGNLLKRESLFLEPGWLVFLPRSGDEGKMDKFWAITVSGKLYEIKESENLSFSIRRIARVYPGVSSPGIIFSDGIYWVPSRYGSIYRFELR